MRTHAFVACLAGCSGSGSLDLELSLPTQADLRPTGMTTVTVTATRPGESPIATTSVLSGDAFTAGDLPIGEDIHIGIVLRDVSNRIVGVGEAAEPISITGDQSTQLTIPVRRPFVFAASGSELYSFDPTLDPRDAKFQGQLGVTSAEFTVSVGGDRLAVIAGAQVQVVVTATNTISGTIAIPGGVTDATAIPGTHKLAVAHAGGIAIVDLDTNTMINAEVGAVDRVTVGPSADGTMFAFGLIDRTEVPQNPPALTTCTGSSSLVTVNVATGTASAPRPFDQAVSDLAAASASPTLYATLPCADQVVQISGDPASDAGAVALTNVAALNRAAVATVAGDRLFAIGVTPSDPTCAVACSPATAIVCQANQFQSITNRLAWVEAGARLNLLSIPIAGGTPISIEIPGRTETIINIGDPAMGHAQVLKALGSTVNDLVALAGGQYIALVTQSRYYIEQYESGASVVLPCLDVTTSDWLLIDMATSSIAQRVRTSCNPIVGNTNVMEFRNWACDTPPEGEVSTFPSYQPRSVGALFGAR
ncbi:MAG: hypothetical protein AB7O24_32165 [Kofleriaceae bacterium]